jgi:hypothetical protein
VQTVGDQRERRPRTDGPDHRHRPLDGAGGPARVGRVRPELPHRGVHRAVRRRGRQAVQQQPERGAPGQFVAHAPARPAARGEHAAHPLGEQPRLADARLAGDPQGAAAAGHHVGHRRAEPVQVRAAADQHALRCGRRRTDGRVAADLVPGRPQRRAGLRAGPLDQQFPQLVVHPQRLRRPPVAVQGRHQQGVRPLAQRVLRHQPAQLGDRVGVPAGLDQQGRQPLGDGRQHLREPQPLRRGERAGHPGQRLAVPERPGLREGRQLLGRAPGRAVPAGGVAQRVEPEHVDRVPGQVQSVAAAAGGEQPAGRPPAAFRLQRPAQRRDVRVDVAGRARRSVLAPHRAHQFLASDRPAGVQGQHAEDGLPVRGPQRHLGAVAPGADRTEQADPHVVPLCRHGVPQPGVDVDDHHLKVTLSIAGNRSGQTARSARAAIARGPSGRR